MAFVAQRLSRHCGQRCAHVSLFGIPRSLSLLVVGYVWLKWWIFCFMFLLYMFLPLSTTPTVSLLTRLHAAEYHIVLSIPSSRNSSCLPPQRGFLARILQAQYGFVSLPSCRCRIIYTLICSFSVRPLDAGPKLLPGLIKSYRPQVFGSMVVWHTQNVYTLQHLYLLCHTRNFQTIVAVVIFVALHIYIHKNKCKYE